MNISKPILTTFGLILLFFIGASMFVVPETERAIILRLGQIQMDSETNLPRVLAPGLHFKVPFVDSARHFDMRIQTLDMPAARFPTKEKKELIINLFTKWRIKDFSMFFKSTSGDKARAETLLKQKIENELRAELGREELNDVVSQNRMKIMSLLKQEANIAAASLGVEVIDVRVVGIDLPPNISDGVYRRMRTERQRIAAELRAQGQSRAEAIQADADATVTVIDAKARKDAEMTRGAGEAEAAKIYAEAYSQAPEFYRFYRSLEAYRTTFQGNNDMLVIKPESEFFQYFHGIERGKGSQQKVN
ncbi:MAG: protease modulator HflC [Gammaproteobacteria bacterium]